MFLKSMQEFCCLGPREGEWCGVTTRFILYWMLTAFPTLVAAFLAVSAEPLDVWTLRHEFAPPVPPVPNLSSPQLPFRGLAYGEDRYVAVGGNGVILTTPDPDQVPWTLRESGTTSNLAGAVHDDVNKIFVAVGSGGTILTSTNGIIWAQQTSGTTAGLNAVTRGNGQFVAVGDSGVILTSPDGAVWRRQNPAFQNAPPSALAGVTYGNGLYVAVGSAAILTSSNSVTWVAQTLPTSPIPPQLKGIVYANGLYVTVGADGMVFTSTNAVNWTRQDIPSRMLSSAMQFTDVTYFNQTIIAVGGDSNGSANFGGIVTSQDGVTWSIKTTPSTAWLNAVAVGKAGVVAVGGGYNGSVRLADAVLTSRDGITWRDAATPPALSRVVFGGHQFVAVGMNGTILTSPDGAVWQRQTVGLGVSLNSVASDGNVFVAVGKAGAIFSSTDGRSWTSRSFEGSRVNFRSVTHGNGLFATVGGRDDSIASVILTSSDGVDWKMRGGLSAPLYGVAYGRDRFVALGGYHPEFRPGIQGKSISTDGVLWAGTTAGGLILTAVTYGNGLFAALDEVGSGLYTSLDGDRWVSNSTGIPIVARNVAFAGGTFAVVGSSGALAFSTNGRNWIKRNTGYATNLNAIAFGKRTFVAVGDFGIILQSGEVAPPPAPTLSGARFSNGVFTFSIPTWDGTGYTLEFKDSLSETNWQMMTRVQGDGTWKPVTDANASARQRFYRVRAE